MFKIRGVNMKTVEAREENRGVNVLNERLHRLMMRLYKHRERYVRAWIAATGVDPRDACIVTNIQPNGEVMVVKRRDEVLTCCKCHEPIAKDVLHQFT